jgi:hypothetical protein
MWGGEHIKRTLGSGAVDWTPGVAGYLNLELTT